MVLTLIGLGLADEQDITLKGLNALRDADHLYLEGYTSLLQVPLERLEGLYGKRIELLGRDGVEQGGDRLIAQAREGQVALLIIGDPFSATTHAALVQQARDAGVEVRIVHNASVITAVGATGLELYRFGRTASIPFGNAEVTTPYDVLVGNRSLGLHTLFLLDLDPPRDRYLSIPDAIGYLLRVEADQRRGAVDEQSLGVGCARLGAADQRIVSAPLAKLREVRFGMAPYCFILPGTLHFVEEELLARHAP